MPPLTVVCEVRLLHVRLQTWETNQLVLAVKEAAAITVAAAVVQLQHLNFVLFQPVVVGGMGMVVMVVVVLVLLVLLVLLLLLLLLLVLLLF